MKRIIIACLLLASTATAAPKAPKRHFAYQVATLAGGQVGVIQTEKTAAAALKVARLLDLHKADGGKAHVVLVVELAPRTAAQCTELATADDSHDDANDPVWMKACQAGEVLP